MIASWIIFNTDSKYKLLTGLLITLGIIVLSIFLEVSLKQMGLEMGTLKQGVITALPFMLTIVGMMGISYLLKPSIFLDTRYDQSLSAMLVSILILLPLTTVLLEELFFRGLFFGYLNNAVGQIMAIIISSTAFGLWHFYTSKSVNLDGTSISPLFLSMGVIIVTALAGAFLAWLRIKGNNLISPLLVHWTINATGIVLSYLAWQQK
jgi:membrane protease YdiL (CAAX protease family)